MGKLIVVGALVMVGSVILVGTYALQARQANSQVQSLASSVCRAAKVGAPVGPLLALGAKLGGRVKHSSSKVAVSFRLPRSETMQCLIGVDAGRVTWANAVEVGD